MLYGDGHVGFYQFPEKLKDWTFDPKPGRDWLWWQEWRFVLKAAAGVWPSRVQSRRIQCISATEGQYTDNEAPTGSSS